MPLPFVPLVLLGGSVIAGVKGTVDTIHATQQIKELNDMYEKRRAVHEQSRAKYEAAHNHLAHCVARHNDLRRHAYDTLQKAVTFLERAKVKNRFFNEDINELLLQQPAIQQDVDVAPIEIIQVVLKAAGVSTATAATVQSAVHTLGIASTGTAISTLSGAAATNATLAWLGGGALAVGGGGMALGTAVLGGLVVGPALLTAGLSLQGTIAQVKTTVEQQIAAMEVAEEKMQNRIAEYYVIQERIKELETTINQLTATLSNMLATADPNREEDLFEVAKVAKGLAEAIDVKILL